MSDWGQGAKNNNIGWGQGAVNNDISWGSVHANSWAGDTNIVGFAYDSDYQAILDAMTSYGYTLPSDEEKLIQNQLILDLKDIDAWDEFDEFYNFRTKSNEYVPLVDWRNPSRRCSVYSGITFEIGKGFKGGGTGYIDTNYDSSTGTKYTINSASRFFYIETGITNNIIDGIDSGNQNRSTTQVISSQRINQGLSTLSGTFGFSTTAGMKSIHRLDSTNVRCVNDKTASSFTANSDTLISATQLILKAGSSFGGHTISFHAMGSNLFDKNDAIVDAYSTYVTSLNAL